MIVTMRRKRRKRKRKIRIPERTNIKVRTTKETRVGVNVFYFDFITKFWNLFPVTYHKDI